MTAVFRCKGYYNFFRSLIKIFEREYFEENLKWLSLDDENCIGIISEEFFNDMIYAFSINVFYIMSLPEVEIQNVSINDDTLEIFFENEKSSCKFIRLDPFEIKYVIECTLPKNQEEFYIGFLRNITNENFLAEIKNDKIVLSSKNNIAIVKRILELI